MAGFFQAEKTTMTDPAATLHVGLLAFRDMTQLDLTGPFEVFARLPGTVTHVIGKADAPIRTDRGLVVAPTIDMAGCPHLDVIVVPGGPGQQDLMDDDVVLSFLRDQAEHARYVTSVCTGALVLGAAGLLAGYQATTHWLSLPLLELFGATPVDARIVIDRNRVTGGGVTAGIDFGLRVAALLRGDEAAQRIQLQIEYNPQPPFHSGSAATAPAHVVNAVREAGKDLLEQRRLVCERAARRLSAAV
jgi:cyclohexyl-isocyanide hydratase